MQMVTLFKQILINVLGSKQTAGAVRDIKDEIPQLGILITRERRTCDGIVHNMDPIGNDTFMTETLYNESGKIIITNTSKEDGPMGQFCHLSSKNCWRTAGKWPDKLPRLSEFLMWVAGQKLGQQFAHSADSYCHKTPLIPEAFRDWTR